MIWLTIYVVVMTSQLTYRAAKNFWLTVYTAVKNYSWLLAYNYGSKVFIVYHIIVGNNYLFMAAHTYMYSSKNSWLVTHVAAIKECKYTA